MKLLVTGGAGFLGSGFVRAVLADEMPGLEGARVTVLDKLTYAGSFANLGPVAENDRLDFVPGDVADAPLVDSVLRGHDAVVHLAAESPSAVVSGTVTGTQVLLDAALRHGTGPFLVVSTHEVYGPVRSAPWAEGAPVAPVSPYAAAKAGADLLALSYHRTHGLPVVVTRGADTYGPYQHPEKPVPHLITHLLSGHPLPARDEPTRQWLHADDHCRALALALTRGTPGEVYHVGGTPDVPDRKLADQLRALCDAAPEDTADQPGDGPRYALDDARIRAELGWAPRIGLDDGLAATVRWYRDHADWWRPHLTG